MTELYKNLGFRNHPFSKFSAEEETEYLGEIFLKPRYFNTLLTDLKSGASRFILGERGSGKSALVLELSKTLADDNVFSVIIDNYDGIPLNNNDRNLLHLIIKNLLKTYVASIFKNRHLLGNLNKQDKERLSLIISDFFSPISKREFQEAYNKVTKYKIRNWFARGFNKIFNKPLNWALSIGLEITSDFISKSLNLPKTHNNNFYKSYIPEVELEKVPEPQKLATLLGNYNLLKEILISLVEIIQKSGYSSTVVFLDKIDEFKLLEGKIKKIVDFTEQILKDTGLLYFNNLSIVFSIWTEVKIELNAKGVRFDKFKPIDVNWTDNEINQILQKRIDYFSMSPTYNIHNLVGDTNALSDLVELSYKSPRDMIRLFSTVFDEQAIHDSNVKIIEQAAIDSAKVVFCKSYDFYSVFPSKRGTKEDIISIVNRILRVGKVNFRTTDLVAEFKYSQQSAISYIKIYKDYGLVRDEGNIVSGGTKGFEVVDPKLIYLVNSGIKSIS